MATEPIKISGMTQGPKKRNYSGFGVQNCSSDE